MAEIPTPRSYQNILGDLEDILLAKLGIQNLRVGAPLLSILETAASSDFRSSNDIFQVLNSISLDTATSQALERIGLSNNVPKIRQSAAIDVVSISDTSFTKIQSKLFQGLPAPIVGSVTLNVTDASLFPSSGNIYLGRGLPNYEGPIPYSSKFNAGTHWTLTLTSPTQKFHNNTENVIVAQGGNRTIGPQTVVQTPQGNLSTAITFKTIYTSTLPDGETSIDGVLVQATTPGTGGNVPAKAISQFATAPFTGATVVNPKPFSNGQDTEDDDSYRDRIKNVIKSRSKGTVLAIQTAVLGITAPDENLRIVSTSFVKQLGKPSILFIDSGNGYEERVTGVPIESLIDQATGGEEYFQTQHRPIAKAFALTQNTAPFILSNGALLTVKVGGVVYVHNFNTSQFTSISSASAYEVTSSINSNPDLGFSARTSGAGTRVAIFAKEEHNDDIEVVVSEGNDSNVALGFPSGDNFTIQLYKNDRLLNKDGTFAIIESEPFSSWNNVTGPQTLTVAVDHTPAITYVFVDQDFVDANTGYIAVGKNSLAAWIAVINAKIPGITAKVVGNKIELTSNLDTSAKAQVSIEDSTLVAAHFFGIVSAVGSNKDYTIDRSTGQIHLESILEAFDRLSVGSKNTRAFLESHAIGNVSLVDTDMWFVVDGSAEVIPSGLTRSSSLSVEVFELHDWGYTLKIEALAGTPFINVMPNDYIILWDPALDPSLHGSFRISTVTDTFLIIERRSALTMRAGHRSVALAPVGSSISKVLTTGGSILTTDEVDNNLSGAVNVCEIYNPNTKTVTPCAAMVEARAHHTANLVASGKVVVVGGINDGSEALNTIEIYNPTLDTWTTSNVSLTTGVYYHTATVMANGKILIAGGVDTLGTSLAKTYIYDPVADTIAVVGDLITPRSKHRAVLLPTNNILVAGGINVAPTATAELFIPGGGVWAATGSMTSTREAFCLQPIGAGVPTSILAVGDGIFGFNRTTYELYNIAGGTWGGLAPLPPLQTFAQNNGIHLQDGDIALLNAYSPPDSASVLTYDGIFHVYDTDPKWTESSVRYDAQYVLLSNVAGTYLNHVVVIGGLEQLTTRYQPTANYEEWDGNTFTWDIPDSATTNLATLTSAGIAFVRTESTIQQITIPAGTNYTASSLVSTLNGLLRGATATPYRTNFLRINTNSFAKTGDISLVAFDENAAGVQLDVTLNDVDNLVGHIGSVESGNSQIGTPSFDDLQILGYGVTAPVVAQDALVVHGTNVDPSYTLVGLKNWTGGASGASITSPEFNYSRSGNNQGFFTTLAKRLELLDATQIYTREAPIQPWIAKDRIFMAAPFSIGPLDDLAVLVDNDIDKRFSINIYRKLSTVNNTYGDTNDFRDADSGNTSLAVSFGLSYDFNDFAVYMKSRAVVFGGDSTRAALLRYFLYGSDGDGTRVRFSNPIAPLAPISVDVNTDLQATTDVRIRLAGGATRNVLVRARTKVGIAALSETVGGIATLIFVLNLPISLALRATNVTNLTLTLPAGVIDHGLVPGDTVFVQSSDVNFSSGLKLITGNTSSTIDYTEIAPNVAPTVNIGTVSYDTQGEATTLGSGVLTGDFIRIDNSDFSFDPLFANSTFHITSFANGFIKATSGEITDFTISTTLAWQPIGQTQNLKVFANPNQTMGSIVTAVNALIVGDNFKNPISMTLLGDGTGVVTNSTPEDFDNTDGWYILSDGVNYVQSTTAPGTIFGNYTLKFKNNINGNLATSADWANEVVYISPITVKNVVEWLNTATVTGLFSLCTIEAASDGTKVQIASKLAGSKGGVQIQGGLANSVTAAIVGGIRNDEAFPDKWSLNTIKRSDIHGFRGGEWVKIENSIPIPRANIIDGLTQLTSWTADGIVSLNNNVYTERLIRTDAKLKVEKQGRYIAISDLNLTVGLTFSSFLAVRAGDYIRLTTAEFPTAFNQVSTVNQGIYKIMRVFSNEQYGFFTVWIENTTAVEEDMECSFCIYAGDSVMPGDTFIVNTPKLGIQNQGVWTVETVGETTATSNDPFTVNTSFKVSTSKRSPVTHGLSDVLGLDSRLVQTIEGTPATFVRKIETIVPNQVDGSFVDIRWDIPVESSTISANSGSIISSLDKISFPTDFASGIDSYSYDNGLIGEANRIVQGDPSDTSTYPGIAAAGAQINVSGPLIKRIKVALSLRVKSGVTNSDIADRVRSAVATTINQTGIGVPIALSKIIAAAEKVVGVVAVTITSPTYNVVNDLITVAPNEKPLVLNLDTDISISFNGE